MPFCQIPSHLRYQIVRQVGEGSAVVYQARTNEVGLPQIVALKATTVGRALHEARILASLQHPRIPRFYALVVDGPEAYVVMEYIEEETLSQYLDAYLAQGALPPMQQVLSMGIQLCAVLDYLHMRQPPITFRDVKPENVMLSADRHLFLIDFDIACPHLALERRSRNRKEEIDKKSWGWLAQENHTSQEEKDATHPLAAPGRTFRARRADSEEDSESEIVCVFAPAPP